MPRKKHTPEQIIIKLREAEVALSTASMVGQDAPSDRGVRSDFFLAERVRTIQCTPEERLKLLKVKFTQLL